MKRLIIFLGTFLMLTGIYGQNQLEINRLNLEAIDSSKYKISFYANSLIGGEFVIINLEDNSNNKVKVVQLNVIKENGFSVIRNDEFVTVAPEFTEGNITWNYVEVIVNVNEIERNNFNKLCVFVLRSNQSSNVLIANK
jgi:hypothetical protein